MVDCREPQTAGPGQMVDCREPQREEPGQMVDCWEPQTAGLELAAGCREPVQVEAAHVSAALGQEPDHSAVAE